MLILLSTIASSLHDWIVDNVCSSHMVYEKSILCDNQNLIKAKEKHELTKNVVQVVGKLTQN